MSNRTDEFPRELTIMPSNLASLLVKAKTNTYASGQDPTRLDGEEKEFSFEEGDFRYRDRYFLAKDSITFIGGEMVWFKGEHVWGMNYVGYYPVHSKKIIGYIDKFLQTALSRVPEDLPLRGPPHFENQQFEYFNKVAGDWALFQGIERIVPRGRDDPVYILRYNGCAI